MIDWRWVGERALLREFQTEPLAAANAAARALAEAVRAEAWPHVRDVVLGATCVTVVLEPGAQPPSALLALLEAPPSPDTDERARAHEIGCAYGGPDLAAVAEAAGLSEQDVVRLHRSASYTVALIGFSPGFPYLIGLPEALHTRRRARARPRVEAGSVGIGGAFTGIYPQAGPGGWNLIGRADVVLFDPGRDAPATLRPGDRVRFVDR